MRGVFERQGLHLLLLALLLAAAALAGRGRGVLAGEYGGLSSAAWYWISLAAPVLHQGFVWLCWRLELHGGRLTRRLGEAAFPLYATGFAALSLARIATLLALAAANAGTLDLDRALRVSAAVVVTIPAAYTFYSIGRHFGFRRALGLDHFDPSFRDRPFVREGIFRWTNNAMYTFGIPIVWVPGLLAASQAALCSALFSNLYIWVHYLCTELPDIRRIYGARRPRHGTR